MKENEISDMPKVEYTNCRLTERKCCGDDCPEEVAGFSAFEVYGRMCRFKTLNPVVFQRQNTK